MMLCDKTLIDRGLTKSKGTGDRPGPFRACSADRRQGSVQAGHGRTRRSASLRTRQGL